MAFGLRNPNFLLVFCTVQSLALGCLEDSYPITAGGHGGSRTCTSREESLASAATNGGVNPAPTKRMSGHFRQGQGGSSTSRILIFLVKLTHGQRHSTLTISRTD